jgi:hypothetical protein
MCVIGNSVGLKMRPPRSTPDEMTYVEHLRSAGWDVRNFSRAGVEIRDAFATFDDDVLALFPEAVVFNFGIVEVSRRRFPKAVWYGARSYDVFLNRVAGRPHPGSVLRRRFQRYPWYIMAQIFNAIGTITGFSWAWTSPSQLAEIHRDMLRLLFKETAARAVVLGINTCSERVEKALPGTRASIGVANNLLREVSASFDRCKFLDPVELMQDLDSDQFIPDGVHFSAEAHRRVGQQINKMLSNCPSPAAIA